jgi:hypothetical protein
VPNTEGLRVEVPIESEVRKKKGSQKQSYRMHQKARDYWQVAYFQRHPNSVKVVVKVAGCFQMWKGYFRQKYLTSHHLAFKP